jgi:glycerophosphoryl diester phosphodiesterase
MHLGSIDENSVSAFEQALEYGCTHIESDVHATKDLVPVLFHDDDLRRVAGIARKISELTFSELGEIRLANGSSVPTLEEVLTRFPDLKLNLDIKSATAVVPTVAVIERLAAHNRVLVSSFSSSRRLRALSLFSSPPATSASMRQVLLLWLSNMFFGIGFRAICAPLDAVQIPPRQGLINLSSPRLIARLRANGLEVHYWTINDSEFAAELVARGASGIVTDRVDLIKF